MNKTEYRVTKELNEIQDRILAKNHGSAGEAKRYVEAVNSLTEKAWRIAQATKEQDVKVSWWQRIGHGGSQFFPDKTSIQFHRTMNKLKLEMGL